MPSSRMSVVGSLLPLIGVALALANWIVRPDAAWASAAAIGMFLITVVVWRRARLAVLRSPDSAASIRRFASVQAAIVFGGLMMIIPLAVTLAQAYGAVDGADGGRRLTMIVFGAFVIVTGNAIPKHFGTAAVPCSGARLQAFQRFAGWTWVLCGLAFTTAWLTLPIDAAEAVSPIFVVAAMMITILRGFRLHRLRHPKGI